MTRTHLSSERQVTSKTWSTLDCTKFLGKIICLIFRLFYLSLRCSGLTMSMKIMMLMPKTMMTKNVTVMVLCDNA